MNTEEQLELFSLKGHAGGSPSYREIPRRWCIQLRHEQLMLGGIVSLIGVAIVFACGVERGKQLVRAEQASEVRPSAPLRAFEKASREPEAVVKQSPAPQPALEGHVKPARKLADGSMSRFAIQVVTYSQSRLASLELQRLQARGERAFLVKRNGRTAVFVGPFPSQAHASEKLTSLKPRYQDCFVKTL